MAVVQATATFVDVAARQTIALVAHSTRTGKGVTDPYTVSVGVTFAACSLTVPQIN